MLEECKGELRMSTLLRKSCVQRSSLDTGCLFLAPARVQFYQFVYFCLFIEIALFEFFFPFFELTFEFVFGLQG